jgi:RNA-binding protein 5/10
LDFEHDHSRTYNSSMEGIHYKSQSPNNTIMIRGLAQHITENDVGCQTCGQISGYL